MLLLADSLHEAQDIEAARAAYQRAIDSDDSDVAPRALFGLGTLLNEQGELAGP